MPLRLLNFVGRPRAAGGLASIFCGPSTAPPAVKRVERLRFLRPHHGFIFYFRSLQPGLNENGFNASHKIKVPAQGGSSEQRDRSDKPMRRIPVASEIRALSGIYSALTKLLPQEGGLRPGPTPILPAGPRGRGRTLPSLRPGPTDRPAGRPRRGPPPPPPPRRSFIFPAAPLAPRSPQRHPLHRRPRDPPSPPLTVLSGREPPRRRGPLLPPALPPGRTRSAPLRRQPAAEAQGRRWQPPPGAGLSSALGAAGGSRSRREEEAAGSPPAAGAGRGESAHPGSAGGGSANNPPPPRVASPPFALPSPPLPPRPSGATSLRVCFAAGARRRRVSPAINSGEPPAEVHGPEVAANPGGK